MTDINKLDWRNGAQNILIEHSEWNLMVDSFIEEGYTENTTLLKTVKREFPLGSYRFDDLGRDKSLYVKTWSGKLLHFYTFNDAEKNDPSHVGGWDAFAEINSAFINEYKIAFPAAFGTWPRLGFDKKDGKHSLYHYALEQCNEALPAIIECDNNFSHQILTGVYKADVSSAYPYELTLPLPTTKNMIGPISGAVEPPQGYVAYWTKSGHVIEHEGVDTRKLLTHPLYKKRHKFKAIDQEKEITYLLPYCEYDLKLIMYDLYERRNENEKNKGIMNSFIGILRSRKEFQTVYMGHLSALVYARHIEYMCKIYDTLIRENCYPLLYATDSVMWLGGPCSIADKDKYLGSFTLEYENCRAIYGGCGSYALENKDGSLAIVKHQGVSAEDWKARNIRTLEDFEAQTYFKMKERYNRKKHKFEFFQATELQL